MSELLSFHEFLSQRLGQFGESVSPEEVLDLWRATHPSPNAYEDDVEAIREALDAMNNGDRGTALETFDLEFRSRNQIA